MEVCRKKVEGFFDTHFHDRDGRFDQLFEAMHYSLLAGGKRIRPVLLMAAGEAAQSEEGRDPLLEEAMTRVAAAIEMIHTYSLIHDDLPAMDNDDLRRGKPTNHKVFGEATAILAGDALLTEAFSVIASIQGVDAKILLEITRDIAEASGGRGMAGGQALDLQSEKKKISPAELETLHRHKTGCLIEVSVTSGAKLAGANPSRLASIQKYGEAIGLAFQVADDILDVEGGTEELGKTAGSDARKDKATYPSLLGMEKSKKMASELMQASLEALKTFDHHADLLREIARYIVIRRK
ncbi:MAG: polyprenyl synthetase family protein [Deltaproteobacteria bacterium]|nr:polyprenyl synthetase family protein [Deltaproteobacteria bacterium]